MFIMVDGIMALLAVDDERYVLVHSGPRGHDRAFCNAQTGRDTDMKTRASMVTAKFLLTK